MPELPEVETIARGLAPEVLGRTILAVQVLDPSALKPSPEAFLALALNQTIAGVGRRGKLLLLHLASPAPHANHNDHNNDHNASTSSSGILAIHLRMTGRVMAYAPGITPDKPRAILNLSGGVALSFADVRRFGSMHAFAPGEIDAWPFYRDLGPEPLTLAASDFRSRLTGSRSRIKALLLDQHVIAGIGNIYADEALFRASIRPTTPASALSPRQLNALHAAIQAVLTQAIAENGSSIRDYRTAHGDAGAFQNHFQAYGRAGKPCTRCQVPMVSAKVAGRTSTYCERCQK
jgi:formamidopyrimidine-DNA glycosylase